MVSAAPAFFLRPGDLITRFTFFISSGSDVLPQRELLAGLLEEASAQFRLRPDAEWLFEFTADRWEQDAPRRTGDVDMNAEFVRRAKLSHATIVLLADEVRKGTREEIEAVLNDAPEVQLSVIWMERPGSGQKSRALKKFLRDHSNEIAYVRTGEPGSPESVMLLSRVVFAALADATKGDRREELLGELR